jgi:replicative DNA helicase
MIVPQHKFMLKKPEQTLAASPFAIAGGVNTVITNGAPIDPLSSVDAEFELCGWFLRMSLDDLGMAQRILDRTRDADMSHPIYRSILSAARALIAKNQVAGANAVLNYAAMNKLDVGGPEHLSQLINNPIGLVADESRLEQDVDLIIEYAVRRRVRKILQDRLNDLVTKPSVEVIRALADDSVSLQSTSEMVRREAVHISDPMQKVLEKLYADNPVVDAIATGFAELDAKLNGGLRDQDLIYLAGRPAMGKTAAAMSIARNISLDTSHRRPVLVFSLEMPDTALAGRLLASEAAIPAKAIQTNEVMSVPAYNEALQKVLPRFAEPSIETDADSRSDTSARLWIEDTPGLSLSDIRSKSRQFARDHGRPIIVIDYLQIIDQNNFLQGSNRSEENRSQAIGKISQGLKNLARELNTPVVVLSQLNRSLEQRANKHPIMSDLRDSGSLEQDADIILFLYRDVVYHPDTENPDEALVIVGKQRAGEMGIVALNFNASIVRFENRFFSSHAARAAPSASHYSQSYDDDN